MKRYCAVVNVRGGRLSITAIVFAMLAAVSICSTRIYADVVFSDDFEDSTLNKWNVVSGSWNVVQDGSDRVAHLARSSTQYRRMVTVSCMCGDITLTAQTRGDAVNDVADMAVGFFSDATGSNFWAVVLGYDPDRLAIFRYTNGSLQDITWNNNVRQENNVWYNVKVKLEGNRIDTKVWRVGTVEPSNWQLSWTAAARYGNHLMLGGQNGQHNEEFWFDDVVCERLPYLCGDANADGRINISDASALVCYIFQDCSAPQPLASGDVDCDGTITVADPVYLVNYIFAGGPPPCDGCK